MTEPTPAPKTAANPIIAEIYATRRLFKRQWRFRFIAANGEKIGDDYNNKAAAHHAIKVLTNPEVPVVLRTVDRDGLVTNLGRIR